MLHKKVVAALLSISLVAPSEGLASWPHGVRQARSLLPDLTQEALAVRAVSQFLSPVVGHPHAAWGRFLASESPHSSGMHEMGMPDPLAEVSQEQRAILLEQLERNARDQGADLVDGVERRYWADRIERQLNHRLRNVGWISGQRYAAYALEFPEKLGLAAKMLIDLLRSETPQVVIGGTPYRVLIFYAPNADSFRTPNGRLTLPAFGLRDETKHEVRVYIGDVREATGERSVSIPSQLRTYPLIHELSEHALGLPHREAFYLEALDRPETSLSDIPTRVISQLTRWRDQAPDQLLRLLTDYANVWRRIDKASPTYEDDPRGYYLHRYGIRVTEKIHRKVQQMRFLKLINPTHRHSVMPLDQGMAFLTRYLGRFTSENPAWIGLAREAPDPLGDPDPLPVWVQNGQLMTRSRSSFLDPAQSQDRFLKDALPRDRALRLVVTDEGTLVFAEIYAVSTQIANTTPEILLSMQYPGIPRLASNDSVSFDLRADVQGLIKRSLAPHEESKGDVQLLFNGVSYDAVFWDKPVVLWFFILSHEPQVVRAALAMPGSPIIWQSVALEVSPADLQNLFKTDLLNPRLETAHVYVLSDAAPNWSFTSEKRVSSQNEGSPKIVAPIRKTRRLNEQTRGATLLEVLEYLIDLGAPYKTLASTLKSHYSFHRAPFSNVLRGLCDLGLLEIESSGRYRTVALPQWIVERLSQPGFLDALLVGELARKTFVPSSRVHERLKGHVADLKSAV